MNQLKLGKFRRRDCADALIIEIDNINKTIFAIHAFDEWNVERLTHFNSGQVWSEHDNAERAKRCDDLMPNNVDPIKAAKQLLLEHEEIIEQSLSAELIDAIKLICSGDSRSNDNWM